ncbi:MAG: ROK family protein [Candidatus Wallbacteria bacterium]|nr:ROK family protein [Candidatus Wallbacteria bacterium]
MGIDVGGTNTRLALINEQGELVKSSRFSTLSYKDSTAFLDKLLREIVPLIKGEAPIGIGIAVPGVVDASGTVLRYAPNLNWIDIPMGKALSDRTGLPVYLENDANLAALGELGFGELKGESDGIALTIGTGIGGGVILNGSLFRGKDGMGTEIGHMGLVFGGGICGCGKKGCFEVYASANGFIRIAAEEYMNAKTTFPKSESEQKKMPEIILTNYLSRIPLAIGIVEKYSDFLAAGIGSLINIFGPVKVVLAGGLFHSGEILLPVVTGKLSQYCFRLFAEKTVIVKSNLIDKSSLLGAYLLLREKIVDQ